MGFEALNWYCKPVADGFWEKEVDGAFGSYTPCAIDSLVMLVSHLVLLCLCFYRIWIIFHNAKAQIFVLKKKYYNFVLGILACYCFVEPVLRLVMEISLFDMDEETHLPPFEVVSLIVEAFAWFSMLVLIGLETKQYVKEFRWYVRFGVVYVLVADAVLLDLVLPLKNSINRTSFQFIHSFFKHCSSQRIEKMARIQLLLYFTILFATATLLDVASAHLRIKATLPKIEVPKTVKDVEPYTVNVVMVYVSNLEKECPKTNRFKAFFEKLRAYAKYVCPLRRLTQKDDNYERDMKAKAGSLFQTIASFAVGKIREEIQEEKTEAIETFRKMKSLAGRIMGGRKKEETEESMTLTPEQQNEIKEGILKWEAVITKIANTMVQATTDSSSAENSTTEKGNSIGTNTNSDCESPNGNSGGSPTPENCTPRKRIPKVTKKNYDGESPNGLSGASPEDIFGKSSVGASENENSFKDTTGAKPISPSGSPTTSSAYGSGGSSISPTVSSTSSTTGESGGASQNGALPVTEVEAETSKEVMSFLMNLEKKCPPKEEYKSFFEKLKGTMTATATAKSNVRKGLFTGIKSGAGKIFDAMGLIRSRIGSKSAELKSSMETYQGEVMKAVQELDAIYSQIVSQNQGKKDGALTCTPAQQKQIKLTITKWEQVTTQFVETSIKTESSSSSTTTTTSGKV